MQKVLTKIIAVFSAFSFAAVMMFSPVIGSPVWSATLISAEEQPITDESKGIAALLTLLFANGIRFAGQWDDVSAGASKLWNDFTTATGNTVSLAALGAGVAIAHGYMRTSAAVNNAVSAFQSWYSGAYSVPSSGNVNIPIESGGTSFFPLDRGKYATAVVTNSMTFYLSTNANTRLIGFKTDSNSYARYYAVSNAHSFTLYASKNNPAVETGGNYASSLYQGYYIATFYNNSGYIGGDIPIVNANSSQDNAIYYTYGGGVVSLPDVSISGQSYDLKDGYNLNTDQSLLLDIANLAALVASIGLTLDSINDLVQDWPAIFDTPWADTDVPDITFPVPIEDTPDNTIPWVNVPDAVSPDPVPDYVPDTPETQGEYKVLGLENVFPFSIPFDLYYLVNVLVAEPETPSFTYALYDPTTSSLVSQEVNLHQFDTFAALLRKLETVLFIASLIFVTRGLIRS